MLTVAKVILAIILILLLLSCCCAGFVVTSPMMAIKEMEHQRVVDDFEQAVNADLPENVRFFDKANRTTISWPLTDDVFRNTRLRLSQSPNGNYALTGEGLYDFTTGVHTLLDCNAADPFDSTPKSFWFDNELFFWCDRVFSIHEPNKLQPVEIKNLTESLSCSDLISTCYASEVQPWLQARLPKIQGIYQGGSNFSHFYFMIGSANESPTVWVVKIIDIDDWQEFVEEVGLSITPIVSHLGRQINEGTEKLSPDGQFKAIHTDRTVTVKRAADDTIVAQISAYDIHKMWMNNSRYQSMIVEGWTDDSRQLIFSVSTTFNKLYRDENTVYDYTLNEHFVLTIP